MTSRRRWRIEKLVRSDTRQAAAQSLSVAPETMRAAYSAQVGPSSLLEASTLPVVPRKVLPHPRHSHRWAPSASRPRRTTCGQPHRGQQGGSPASPEASASMTASSASRAALLSSPLIALNMLSQPIADISGPSPRERTSRERVARRADRNTN